MSICPPTAEKSVLTDADALQEGVRLGNAGIWRWKIDSEELEWTRNLEGVHQLPAGSFDGTLSSFQRDIHPDDADAVWQSIADSIATGATYKAVYRTAPRTDAPTVWIETAGGVTVAPDGIRYLSGICHDVTERVKSELILKRRLQQHTAVAAFGTFALNEPQLSKVMDRAVRIAADVLQVPLTKILAFADSADYLLLCSGIGWADGLVGHGKVGIERASQAGYTLLSNEPVIVRDLLSETRFNGPQLLHDHRVRSGISVVIPGPETRPFGVFGIHTRELREFDQSDAEFLQALANIVAGSARQVAAGERQRLLIREMAHRAGNLLQLVTSIARQTLTATHDVKTALISFSERLGALAKSNYVVSRGGWTSTRFVELVEEAFRPFGDRVSADGRDILLPPDLCFDLGIVLHELATNSVKHGTLGKLEGVVKVTWWNEPGIGDGGSFCLVWDDPFSAPGAPQASGGFGSILVRALIEQKWKGKVDVRSEPNFRITLTMPVERGALSFGHWIA